MKTRKPLADQTAVHDQVYEAIRQALITGRIAPGKGVSLRSLAAELGVSPMPVRDAVRRLAAERALAINPANKRLSVPSLTADRLEQLSLARLWVEPELAARAALNADASLVRQLQAIDADSPDVPELVSLAKAKMGDTFHLVSNEMVQMHGGIGMTDAHDAGFYMKRARAAEAAFGSQSYHRDRYAKIQGY